MLQHTQPFESDGGLVMSSITTMPEWEPGHGVSSRRRSRIWRWMVVSAVSTWGFSLWSQGPVPPDVAAPLLEHDPAGELDVFADAEWKTMLAETACQSGYYSIAEGLYRSLLESAGANRTQLREWQMGLATVLIALGKVEEASAVLLSYEEPRGSAWELRRAAVAFLRESQDVLGEGLSGVEPGELSPEDVGWYHFLRAMLAGAEGERRRADDAFQEALATSVSEAQAAWFRAAQYQARINQGEANEVDLARIRKQMADSAGQPLGFRSALQAAVLLYKLDRKPEAIDTLSRLLRTLPASEAQLRDETLLLLGLIAGGDTGEGNSAFRDLLRQGTTPDWQRVALQRLAAVSHVTGGPTQAGLEPLLDELLARDHPLKEDLYFFRAELALRNGAHELAEDLATELLTLFPGSALGPNARALLASSSWERGRYRTAADHLERIRVAMPPGADRARLSVLIGECYYRAGMSAATTEDFRRAAAAYSSAEAEFTTLVEETGESSAAEAVGASRGMIFFQRVLSMIRGGEMSQAASLLQSPDAARIDVESRWQAEWNLVRFLQLAGRSEEALLALEGREVDPAVPEELKLRFLWLAAQLTLETGRPAETESRVQAVRTFLDSDPGRAIPEALRTEVLSNAALLSARARFDLGDSATGIMELERLRSDFPGSRAAVFSYIIQARYLSAAGQLVEAQRLLIKLVEDYPASDFAPLALFEAAMQAQARGQDSYLLEAKDLLEKLARDFPGGDFEFYARLRQGDILRRLNQFSAAEQLYQYVENEFADHAERYLAQMSLADTLLAQVDVDPSKFDSAISLLERLTDLPDGPADLRAEAGFKLGYAWETHGDSNRASEAYWDLYQRFLGDLRGATQMGPNTPYWLSRGLLQLGQLEEKAGRLASARESYEAVLKHGLPGAGLARGRLARFTGGG